MNPKRGVDSGRLEDAVGDHRLRAVRRFLRRLERELHGACEGHRREPARHFEPNRDMPIVSAGVHLAGVAGTVGNVVRFFDGQSIHVGAEQDAAAIPPFILLYGHDARLADPRSHLIVERTQAAGDERRGSRFLEPQLGMLVDLAPRGDELLPIDRGQGHTVELGQSRLRMQSAHRGRRAIQTPRP